jgi:hypothetical protein
MTLFLEGVARPLLIVHAISAAVLVASTTHHLVWCRGYLRGSFKQYAGERRFALIACCAFLITFVLGNFLYPTYKVRVRAEYFDNPPAIADEIKLRAAQRQLVGLKAAAPIASPAPGLSAVARAFDIKEHWAALGAIASLALLALSRRAHPKDHPRVLVLYLGLAMLVCATAWFGAIVGLVTASFRSVGGVT